MIHGNIKEELEQRKNKQGDQERKVVLSTSTPRSPLLDSKWETMYASLLKYKEEKGDTLVPNRYPKLGSWVSTQRRYYKESMLGKETPLTPKRIQMLQDAGFVWEPKKPNHVPWETRYQELVEYQSHHGHCLVPINYSENMQLAIWVSTQRQEYKLWYAGRPCRITSHQIQLLQNIGFSFEPPRGGSRVRKRRRESTESMDSKCSAVDGPRKNQIKTPFIPKGTSEEGRNQLNSDATTPWIKLFKEYIWYKDSGKDINGNASLKRWCQQQEAELKRWEKNPMLSELNQEHVNLLKSVAFGWEDESQRIILADENIDSKATHDDGCTENVQNQN